MDINLGAHVKDLVSGFEGVATARIEFLNGCVQICIRPTKLGKDGNPLEGQYFDLQQVKLVSPVHKNVSSVVKKYTGGPSHMPGRSLDAPPRRIR